MSKQSAAKLAQGYSDKPANCGSCFHYSSQQEKRKNWRGDFVVCGEKMKRCSLGGFAVKKTAVCNRFERRKS